MRICVVYDCLYPCTVGGAERWYRNLAERLAGEGHEVTYLTLRQWDRGKAPTISAAARTSHVRAEGEEGARTGSVRVLSAGPRMQLYVGDRRRIVPPLVFGAGVLWHLLRRGRRYDVVHSASFPYFSLLAAGATRRLSHFDLVVDWHEVWSREYWREYLGRAGGALGYRVQLLCARLPQRAFCFSQLHAARLRAEGLRGEVTVLRGQYVAPQETARARGGEAAEQAPGRLLVFAGRLIPEKRVVLAVEAIAAAAPRIPGLRAVFYGEGPERARLLRAIDELGVREVASAPGFAPAEQLDADLARAMCMLLPSRREGYGKVVVEASARGTPSIVVAAEDNAATELIEDGVNGLVVSRAQADAVAEAIVRVHEAGEAMRQSTARWYEQNARALSLESSLEVVLASYAREPATQGRAR